MTKYTEAKTKFVKQKIKHTHWKDRYYIDNLLFIERWISKEERGMPASVWWTQVIRDKYPKEIQEIGLELDPKNYKNYYKEYLKDEARIKKDEEDSLRKVTKYEKEERKDWKKAGGLT